MANTINNFVRAQRISKKVRSTYEVMNSFDRMNLVRLVKDELDAIDDKYKERLLEEARQEEAL